MRYEDGLAALCQDPESLDLTSMTMAHLAGLTHRLPEWLAAASRARPQVNPRFRLRLFEAVQSGDAEAVEKALLEPDLRMLDSATWAVLKDTDPAQPEWLDLTLEVVVRPLLLLGHGDVLSALHVKAVKRLGSGKTARSTAHVALGLAEARDWTHALAVLEQARQARVEIDIAAYQESLLWKYAYLHREIEHVMPALALMLYRGETPHHTEGRTWELKAYQIRAGMSGVDVPVIEIQQPFEYHQAVAMQIAALEDDPAAAARVAELRRALRPRPIEFVHADRGVSTTYDLVQADVAAAPAKIAARRKDYAKAAAVARRPAHGTQIEHAENVIEAFLEEGDWRGAAGIAKEHDERKRKVTPGFDDTRVDGYIQLQEHLAIAAAWSGDDAAAASFLAEARTAHAAGGAVSGRYNDGDRDPFLWLTTLLAGVSEGLLPRQYLHLLVTPFRRPY